ncbi:MAG TPA: 2-phospho-L-lactate guanylyltransferase [Solirubrobacterales bacterium]|nr:2-phospho-L-lactate guanylyltransferase [Solirubrobacterales bacterium]
MRVRATAIVPVKRFGAAKQRLLEALDRPQRAVLVRAMLADVLSAATAAEGVERVIVVTGEGRAERIALRLARRVATPIEVLREPRDAGHSVAATLGIVRAKALGARCTALLPGDCPLLEPAELDAALGRMRPNRVAVVPDRHGTGTNALLLSPPDAIAPAFGPGSRDRHAERARGAGHEVAIEPVPSLALDLDTPDDLAALAATIQRDPGRAAGTAGALARLGRLEGAASG